MRSNASGPWSLLALAGGAALAAAQWFVWQYAPIEQTMGLMQKIFYLHMPLAWWSFASFTVVFGASVWHLWKRSRGSDLLAGAAAEIGVLMSGLALVTGSLWGRQSWGVWWTWDPRLTTTLIMWFVYAAYLALRSSDVGGGRRGLLCAALGVAAFLDVPLVFYSARLWRSIHPAVLNSQGGGLEPEMKLTLFVCLGAMGLFWLALLRLRWRLAVTEDRVAALAAAREE